LSDEATTMFFTVGLRRQASSTDHVPATFVCRVLTGLRFAIPTMVCAAR